MNDSLVSNEQAEHDKNVLISISNIQVETAATVDRSRYFQEQQEALKKQTSLYFTSNFLQNFNPTQQDLEDNILYQRRWQNGLEWDVLKDGFVESRSKIRSLELEQKFYAETQKFTYHRFDFPSKMNHTIYLFNHQKNRLLEEREKLLTEVQANMERLHFLKKITKEKMLEIHSKIAEVQALKAIYSVYNEYKFDLLDSSLLNADLGLFDVNYKLVNQISPTITDTLKNAMMADLERQNQWFRQIRLKTFVRHTYYDLVTTDPNSRSFFSVGAGLTIPLTFNQKHTLEAEKQDLLRRFESVETAKTNNEIDILNESYEYRYHLKQYVLFYQKKQLILEKIRQERVKEQLKDADYSPVHVLELIDQLYQIEIELLDIKQNLYIRLLKIHEKLKNIPMDQIAVPFELPNFISPEEQIQRSVYIWSKAFETYKLEFLTEYITYNQFEHIDLAVGNDSDSILNLKLKFLDQMHALGMDVNLMFGQNKILQDANPSEFFKSILKQYPLSKVQGIHLDIEPHTTSEWKTNKAALQEKYLKILQQAKAICTDYELKLSVDLPLTLDSSYVVEIEKIGVDELKFMCYENVKFEYLIRKINQYPAAVSRSISLRTEDFTSRKEMEEFCKKLAEALKLYRFNFHDINRLIKLDEHAMEEKNK